MLLKKIACLIQLDPHLIIFNMFDRSSLRYLFIYLKQNVKEIKEIPWTKRLKNNSNLNYTAGKAFIIKD